MASNSFEAETKRNNITEQYRADANSSGILTSNFSQNAHDLLSLALANAVDEGGKASFMLSGAQQTIQAHQTSEINRKKRQQECQFINTIDMLNKRLEEIDTMIAETEERLAQVNERRLEIGDQLEALDDLEELRESGGLDTQNPTHQRIMKKAGINPNASAVDIAMLIQSQRAMLGQEDEVLEEESNVLIKRREDLQLEREEVLAAKAEIENADTPEAMALVEENAQTLLGQQQLNDLTYLSDDANIKTLAADAIAQNDSGDGNDVLTTESVSKSQNEFIDMSAESFAP